MKQAPVVQFQRATKKIGKRILVNDLSFDIPAGEVFGFLGPNGAGKTTTIRMMDGLKDRIHDTVFTIIIATDMVAGEYTNGTMKFLLFRPNSRAKILFSKYIAVFLFAIVMLMLLLICGYATNALLYGWGNIHTTDLFLNQHGQVVQQNILIQIIKMYGLSIFPVMSYVTLAFAVSTVLRNSVLALGISLFIMIVGNSMIEATARLEWLKYLPFANSDISLYIYHLPARPEMTLNFSIAVLLVYIAALTLLSWFVFKKRDVSI